jgi:HlyD family secretion protein
VGVTAFRVDDLSSLLVDVDISEVDINRVEVGQQVSLTFDAILSKAYEGEVVEVSPVGTLVQGLVNFKVTIRLVDPDELVKPGMTAAVNIVVDELDDVLLVPNRAVRVDDGERFVYMLVDGQLERVPIQLGASSDRYSAVVSGDLDAGDEVVLNPPVEIFSMDGPPSFMGQ